eukprot:SAG31_NODE_1106_length_9878_cov_4.621331_5_plen_142_part_00
MLCALPRGMDSIARKCKLSVPFVYASWKFREIFGHEILDFSVCILRKLQAYSGVLLLLLQNHVCDFARQVLEIVFALDLLLVQVFFKVLTDCARPFQGSTNQVIHAIAGMPAHQILKFSSSLLRLRLVHGLDPFLVQPVAC